DPAATISQVEIFGPVLVATTFRTPAEAVELANNSRYGLAASIWSENLDLALDIASQVKAGVVWVHASNMFDAAAAVGGDRESGSGREGGRQGMYEYLVPDRHCGDAPGPAAAAEEPEPEPEPARTAADGLGEDVALVVERVGDDLDDSFAGEDEDD